MWEAHGNSPRWFEGWWDSGSKKGSPVVPPSVLRLLKVGGGPKCSRALRVDVGR